MLGVSGVNFRDGATRSKKRHSPRAAAVRAHGAPFGRGIGLLPAEGLAALGIVEPRLDGEGLDVGRGHEEVRVAEVDLADARFVRADGDMVVGDALGAQTAPGLPLFGVHSGPTGMISKTQISLGSETASISPPSW